MADLIAQGAERTQRWRRRLPNLGQTLVLGRDAGSWSVPWDHWISRQHVEITVDVHDIHVRRVPAATNPVYFQGRATDEFRVALGQHFVIGTTRLTLVDHRTRVSLAEPLPDAHRTFSAEYLRGQHFQQTQQHLEALSRLPDIIRGADSDRELYPALMQLLLTGVHGAEAAAIVELTPSLPDTSVAWQIDVLHWDRVETDAVRWKPSGPLIAEAVRSGESVLHSWQSAPRTDHVLDTLHHASDFDWAFCTPLTPEPSEAGRAIYVAGRSHRLPRGPEPLEAKLHDALKFVELVGSTVSNLQELRRLQHRDAALAQFFSPLVRDAIAGRSLDEVLAPRETEVTVLFCDLHGFSRRSEASAERLRELLQRVSESLGLVTRGILDFGGVIGDFHGDAVMGFWGWPMEDPRRVLHGCLAAVAIRAAFEHAARQAEHALHGFRVGMGLATGSAVAGKLGTVDQVKVTAFGPVVNIAARLEGISRHFGASILTDASTAHRVAPELDSQLARLRPVCTVQPYGMEQSHEIFELAPASSAELAEWDRTAADYGAARAAFREGNWSEAHRHFTRLSEQDPLRPFFLGYLERHQLQPPDDWQGTIRLTSK
jgi:adenylate cyclase